MLVGPDKTAFEVPISHLVTTNFFAKALNGKFKEGVTKIIELPEDDVLAFKLYLLWLYAGIPQSQFHAGQISLDSLIHLLLMADKWCVPNLSLNVAKQICNYVHDKVKPSGSEEKDYAAIISNGYISTKMTPYRFIFVHAAWTENCMAWSDSLEASMDACPEYFRDAYKWWNILQSVLKTDPNIWKYNQTDLDEENAHNIDKVLVPLLFDSEIFPDIFSDISNVCPSVDKRRTFIREYLGM